MQSWVKVIQNICYRLFFSRAPICVKTLGKYVINTTSEFLKILKTRMFACTGKYVLISILAHYILENEDVGQ